MRETDKLSAVSPADTVFIGDTRRLPEAEFREDGGRSETADRAKEPLAEGVGDAEMGRRAGGGARAVDVVMEAGRRCASKSCLIRRPCRVRRKLQEIGKE